MHGVAGLRRRIVHSAIPRIRARRRFACSITGGYVYRGTEDTLYGEYFYGDYCSGAIWSINRNTGAGTNWTAAFGEAAGKRREIASFGEGGGGALYVLHENGDIFRIGAVAPACDDQLDNDGDGAIDDRQRPRL